MGFLDTITLPTRPSPKPAKSSGGFLDSVILPPKNYVEPATTLPSGGMEFKTLPNAKLVPDNFIPVGQEIKTPFMQSGTVVPSGGGVGAGYSAFKSLIEFPEKGLRSLLEIGGVTKQKETKQWRVPSYSEVASKNVGQLIDEGIPPTAAVILGGSQVAGEFAGDALIFQAIFGSAIRGVATKVAKDEAQTLAYDFLGRPKTLVEAEKSFKAIQKEFHPDISGSDVISKQANNAITILRKQGIPTTNILQRGTDALLNRPLSSLFKKPPVSPTVPTTAPAKVGTLAIAERAGIPKPPAPKPLPPKPIEGVTREVPTITKEVPKIEPEVVKVPSEQLPVKTTGELQVSRLEARQKEILDRITPEQAKEQGISTFEQMNKKEQIAKATEYVLKNPDEALRVVKGEIPPPKDLLNNSIALALETQAELTGNAELVSKLASLRSTRFGQEISILTEADPLNIVGQTRQIQIARENAIIKKTGKTLIRAKADVKVEIDKIIKEERTLAQIKVAEAEKLLESIMC